MRSNIHTEASLTGVARLGSAESQCPSSTQARVELTSRTRGARGEKHLLPNLSKGQELVCQNPRCRVQVDQEPLDPASPLPR